jgi:hypothetical protein
MLVVCPPNVRSVWADPDPSVGEIAKWWPEDLPITIREYRADKHLVNGTIGLQVLVTNPEFLRRGRRLEPLLAWCRDRRVLLVGDESWQWSSPTALQTKAMFKLREVCPRRVLLNGTPGEPRQTYAQFMILNKHLFPTLNWHHWKARYCVMGGWQQKEIVGYQRMEEFAQLTQPYAITRKTVDCFDMGETAVYTTVDVPLTAQTWRHYKAMEKDLIVWLSSSEASNAASAGVKLLRLAQLTSGLLGGVEGGDAAMPGAGSVRRVGDEKSLAVVRWLRDQDHLPPRFLVFSRFRADIEHLDETLAATFDGHEHAKIYGGQDGETRMKSKALLRPNALESAFVVANAQSGGIGLDFSGASTVLFAANDFSLKNRQQAEARVKGPNQRARVTYVDFLATGPEGEPTIDHTIVRALRKADDLATWTADRWRRSLEGA